MSKGLSSWLGKMLGQTQAAAREESRPHTMIQSRRRRVLGQAMVLELLEVRRMLSTVAGRNLFYNNSAFDGSTGVASIKDDKAIAIDKVALVGNQTATFSNYSSYSRGINGIMVDILDLPTDAKLTAADFEFSTGNSPDATFWSRAPEPNSITVRRGAGKNNSDRVTIIWADGAIQKSWLQVVVLPTANTGLAEPDIFYFGSAPGETGNDGQTRVNSTDEILIRWNPKTLLNPAAITDPYDINRDRKVDGTDQILARNNITNLKTDLAKLKPTLSALGTARVQMLSAVAARLTWYDSSLEDRGVVIEASENGGAFEQVAVAPRNASAAIVKGLSPGASYTFRIVTKGAGGASVSQTVSGQMPEQLSTGTCPTYYRIRDLELMKKGEATYTGSENPKLTAKDLWIEASSWEEAMYTAVTGIVHIDQTGAHYNIQTPPNPGNPQLSNYGAFQVGTALNLSQRYAGFDLRNPAYGGLADSQAVIVLEDTYHTTAIDLDYDDFYWKFNIDITQTPGAPFHIIAIPITGTDIQVTWQPSTAPMTRQILERSIDGGLTWEEAGRLGPSDSTFLDRRLSYNRDYTYRVFGEDDDGNEFRTDETATAHTFDEQPEIIYYKITNVTNFTPTGGHPTPTGSLGVQNVDEWILANSPAEAAWLALTGAITVSGRTYRFNKEAVADGPEITSGAFRIYQDPNTGSVSIKLEDTFDASVPCSYDWLDDIATVSYEASPIGVLGDVRGVGGHQYELTLDANHAPVTGWTVQWDINNPASAIPYGADPNGEPKVVTYTYPAVTGNSEVAYTIKVTAHTATGDIETVDKRIFMGKPSLEGETEEELATLNTSQSKRFILEYFSDIYSTIKYQPYAGEKKGPDATKLTGAGNDWDQASLLAKQISAKVGDTSIKYVYQVVNAPIAKIRDWLGVKDNASAWEVLHKAGVLAHYDGSNWTVVDPDDYDDKPTEVEAPQMKGLNFWHAWLRVRVPGTANDWWDLDPSFKYRRFNKGVSSIGGDKDFKPDQYRNLDQTASNDADKRQLPLTWYEGQVMEHIAGTKNVDNGLKGRVGIGDIAYDGPIIAKNFSHPRIRTKDNKRIYEPPRQTEYFAIATSPVYEGVNPSTMAVGAGASVDFTHRVVLQVKIDSDYYYHETFSVPNEGSLSIGIGTDIVKDFTQPWYVDRVASFKYRPRIIINGQARWMSPADGSDQYYGFNAPVLIRLWTIRPGESSTITDSEADDPRRSQYFRRAYQRHGILINAQQHSVDSVMKIQERLNAWGLARNESDKYQTELMAMAANTYSFEYEQQRQSIAGITQTMVAQSGIEVGLASTLAQYQVRFNDGSNKTAAALQNPILLDREDPTDSNFKSILDIDLGPRRDHLVPIQHETNTTRLEGAQQLAGYTSSALEHSVIQNVLNARAVSSALVFQRATKTSVPIVELGYHPTESVESWVSTSIPAPARAKLIDELNRLRWDGCRVTFTNGPVSLGDTKAWAGVAFEAKQVTFPEKGDVHVFGIIDKNGKLLHGGEGDATQVEVGGKGEDQNAMAPFGSGVVNLYSGDLTYSEADFSIPNPTLPFEFRRYYDSSRLNVNRGLGAGWGHSYSDYLDLFQEGAKAWKKSERHLAAARVILVSGAGTIAEFKKSAASGGVTYYNNPSGLYGQFSFDAFSKTYTYIEKDGSYRVFEMNPDADASPRYRLLKIGDRFGNSLRLSYYDAARVTANPTHGRIGDLFDVRYFEGEVDKNRGMHFLWNVTNFRGHIRLITEFSGRSWAYEYGDLRIQFKVNGKEYDGKKLYVLTKVKAPMSASVAPANGTAEPVSQQIESRYTYLYGNMIGGKLASAERWIDDHERNSYNFSYYANGRVFKIIDPDGNPEYYSYNLFSGKYGGERRTFTSQTFQFNRAAEATQNDYDDDGLSTRIIAPDRSRVTQGWENYNVAEPTKPTFRVIWRQGEAGLFEAFYYDDRGDVLRHITGARDFNGEYTNWKTKEPSLIDGFVTDITYWNNVDKYGNPDNPNVKYATIILPQDSVDMAGLLGPLSEQLERRTINRYSDDGRLLWTKDAAGNITAFTYNSNGQIQYKGLPGGTTLTGNTANIDQRYKVFYEYDPSGSGQVWKVHRYLGSNLTDTIVSRNEYDTVGLGRALESFDGTSASGTARSIRRRYDVFGRVIDEINRANVMTSIADGAVPSLNADITTHYTYDGDWLTSTSSPGNVDHTTKTTNYGYDLRGHRISSKDLLTQQTAVSVYDAMGNMIASIDALANRTNYYYDTRNRRYQTLYADNGFEQMLYDAVGRVTEKHVPAAQVLDYRLDPVSTTHLSYGRDGGLRATTDPVGNFSVQDINRFGEVVRTEDWDSRTNTFAPYREVYFLRDNLGRVIQESHPQEGDLIIGTTYDKHGNVTQVDRWKDDVPSTLRTSVAVFNQLDQKVIEASAQRDASATFNSLTVHVTLADHGYAVGDRIWVTNTNPGNSSAEGLFFVENVINKNEFTYHRTSNPDSTPLSMKIATAVTSYGYDLAGRVESVIDPRGFTTNTTYDAAGRAIQTLHPAPDSDPTTNSPGVQPRPRSTMQYYADGTLARRYDPSFWDTDGTGATDKRSVTTNRYLYGDDFTIATSENKILTTVKVSDVESITTTKYLDQTGRTIGIKDGRNNITEYLLDRRGRQLKVTPPADVLNRHPVTVAQYDAAGQTMLSAPPARGSARSTFDAAGRVTWTGVTQQLGATSAATTWALDRDGDNDVSVKIVIPKTSAYKIGDHVNVYGAVWTEFRSQSDGVGDPDPATTQISYPPVGEYASSLHVIGNIDNTNPSFTVLFLPIDAKGAAHVDVFLPSFNANTAPVVQMAVVLTESLNFYKGPNLDIAIDSRGFQSRFVYDSANRVTDTYKAHAKHRAPNSNERLAHTDYDAFGEVEKQTSYATNGFDDPRVTIQTYDQLGRTVRTTRLQNPADLTSGLHTTSGYDAKSQLRWTTSAKGNKLNQLDPVIAARDQHLYSTNYEYDGLGRKIREILPDPDPNANGLGSGLAPSPVNQFQYDSAGNLTRTIDALERESGKEYDLLNRETARASGGRTGTIAVSGGVASLTLLHHNIATGDRLYLTNANGDINGTHIATRVNENQITFSCSGSYSPMAVKVHIGEVTTSYDANGNVLTVTDPRNNITRYEYDALNRKTSQTLPQADALSAAPVTTYSYTLAGDLESVTDPRGNADLPNAAAHTILYEYDGLGRKVKEQLQDSDPVTAGLQRPVQQYKYDPAGNLIESIDARGFRSHLFYDWAGRQAVVRNAAGVIEQITYDSGSGFAEAQLGQLDADGNFVAGHNMKVGDRIFLSLEGISTESTAYNGVLAALVISADTIRFKPNTAPFNTTVTRTGDDVAMNYAGSRSLSLFDDVGNLLSTSDSYGHETRFAYDSLDRKITQTMPDPDDWGPLPNPVTMYRYDENGNLTSVTDPKGSDQIIDHQLTDADAVNFNRHTTTYAYDGLDRKVKQTSADPDPSANGTSDMPVTHYQYDAAGNIVTTTAERTDPRDDVSATLYDQLNRVIATGRDARTATIGVSGTNSHQIIINLPSHGMSNGELVLITDLPAAFSGYNGVGQIVDADSSPNSIVVDVGNLSLPLGYAVGSAKVSTAVTETSYDANGNILSVRDPRNYVTTYLYDNLNRKTRQTLPGIYDGTGLYNPVTTYEYDLNGNLFKSIDPWGNMAGFNSVERQYHSTITDYDAMNRKIKVYFPQPDPLGVRPTNSFGYDLSSNLISETDARDQVTLHGYDALSREVFTQLPDADGSGTDDVSITTAAYDSNGNKMFVTTPRGNEINADAELPTPVSFTSFFAYDALNRQVAAKVPDPNGSSQPNDSQMGSMSATEYDLNGNVLGTVDAIANAENWNFYDPWTIHSRIQSHYHSNSTTYDDLNRPVMEYLADANSSNSGTDVPSTTYTYDKLGNVLTRKDSNDNQTTFIYDALNRVKTESIEIDTGQANRNFTYDAAGNLVHVANRNDQQINYVYDALNRKTFEEWFQDAEPLTLSDHVAYTTYNVNGQRIAAYDNNSSFTYTYDYLNRLTQMNRAPVSGLPAEIVTYEYNPNGQAIHMTQSVGGSSQIDQRNAYDAQGRITTIRQSTQVVEQVNFSYDADGNRTGMERWSGTPFVIGWPIGDFFTTVSLPGAATVTTARSIDEAGRVTLITHAKGDGSVITEYRGNSSADSPIEYDPNVRITNIFVDTPGDDREGQYQYDYDANDQLLSADFPNTVNDETHSYDNERNRTDTGYSTNLDNRLSSDGTHTYGYDNEGNITARDADTSYVYDEGNRLKTVTGPDFTATYTYDVDGNRLTKDVDYSDASATDLHERYFYDAAGRLLLVANESNTVIQRYMQGPAADEPLAEERVQISGDDRVHWLLPDQLGSIRDVVDATGLATNHIVYDAFGGVDTAGSTGGAQMASTGSSEDVPGTEDPNWTVDGDPAVITNKHPNWVTEPEGTRWISYAADTSSPPSGFITRAFETTVTLPTDVPANQLKLVFRAATDNEVTDIRVNGNSTGKTFTGFGTWTEITLTADDGLVGGENTITFDVYNWDGTSLNPTGLIVDWFPGQRTERFMYTGQEHDAESGMTYMNARYYDPAIGRFISQDPLGFDGGFNNLYSYVGNNTTNLTDPTGENPLIFALWAIAMFAPAAVGAIADSNASVREALADVGGWLGERFGVEKFTMPLGFGSISFGKADDGTETFGFSTGMPIGGMTVGSNLMIREGPNGSFVGYGPNWGIGVSGFGYQFSYTSGMGANIGFSLGKFGSDWAISPNIGFSSSGMSAGVSLVTPALNGAEANEGTVAPRGVFGAGYDFGSDSANLSAGVGFFQGVENKETGEWSWSPYFGLPAITGQATFTRTGVNTGYSVSWNPIWKHMPNMDLQAWYREEKAAAQSVAKEPPGVVVANPHGPTDTMDGDGEATILEPAELTSSGYTAGVAPATAPTSRPASRPGPTTRPSAPTTIRPGPSTRPAPTSRPTTTTTLTTRPAPATMPATLPTTVPASRPTTLPTTTTQPDPAIMSAIRRAQAFNDFASQYEKAVKDSGGKVGPDAIKSLPWTEDIAMDFLDSVGNYHDTDETVKEFLDTQGRYARPNWKTMRAENPGKTDQQIIQEYREHINLTRAKVVAAWHGNSAVAGFTRVFGPTASLIIMAGDIPLLVGSAFKPQLGNVSRTDWAWERSYEVKLPGDMTKYAQQGALANNKLAPGTYVYVRTPQGKVYVLPNQPHGHPLVLGNARAASGAGELTVNEAGVVVRIDNQSGTFRFSGATLPDVQNSLRQQGVKVAEESLRFVDP